MSDNPRSSVRVLVADDDEHNRRLLGEICASEGYQVESVANGRAVLERVRAGGCDLVLLDAAMPEMSGYEVLEALHRDRATAHVPVILVTAYPQENARQRALDLGVAAYVEKPFRIFDLTQHIRIALRRPRDENGPPTLPRIRIRRALADALPALPTPHQLRPFLRRAIEDAVAAKRDVACVILRLDSAPRLVASFGRTVRDAVLGAMLRHVGPDALGPIHRADDDGLLFFFDAARIGELRGIVRRVGDAARDAFDEGAEGPVDLRAVAVLLRHGAPPADADSLLRAVRRLASHASSMDNVTVEEYRATAPGESADDAAPPSSGPDRRST